MEKVAGDGVSKAVMSQIMQTLKAIAAIWEFFFFFQGEMDTFQRWCDMLHFRFKRTTWAVVQSLDCRRTSKQEDQCVRCCNNPHER